MYTYPNNVICVTNRTICSRPIPEQVSRVAEVGIKTIILREKDLPESEYYLLAEQTLQQCRVYGIHCILHYYPNVAKALNCNSIHMPYGMLTKEISDSFEVVGTSVHSVQQAITSERNGATYITAGHIFATDCKKGLAPRGTDYLKSVCDAVNIPVYAIGGINKNNYTELYQYGASGVCMMSELMKV